ncbi:enkurin domain-containing protein 1 isoform 1-T3 [Discoglossus pictus]
MSEGASRITGPIPSDPGFCIHPASARGRLEGTSLKMDFMSGPLAPDPILYPKCYSARPANPAPRIHPNARDILDRGQKGTVGILLQLEGLSLHPDQPPKRKVNNHEKENVRRMREIQKKCREKEDQKEQGKLKPVKALWKSQKYENVESKVKAKLQESFPSPSPESVKFLKAFSRCGSGIQPKRSMSPGLSQSRTPIIGEELEMQIKGSSIDFVSYNARNARKVAVRRSRSLQSLYEVQQQKQSVQQDYDSKQKGHVPQYLVNMKEKWRKDKEEREKQAVDPACPPGHTMMPEAERQQTLSNIKETHAQLIKELLALPVRADTLSIQSRRTEFEKKLSELEEAIKIFSRPKVFIRIDS